MTPDPEQSTEFYCPDCRRARLFEQPDGPDWACVVCGAALVVDPVLGQTEIRPGRAA